MNNRWPRVYEEDSEYFEQYDIPRQQRKGKYGRVYVRGCDERDNKGFRLKVDIPNSNGSFNIEEFLD